MTSSTKYNFCHCKELFVSDGYRLSQDDRHNRQEILDSSYRKYANSPAATFKIGERVDDLLSMYLADIFTLSLNLSASCGLSVPCGFDSKGLPIGLQLIGNTLQEATILNTAFAYEQAIKGDHR